MGQALERLEAAARRHFLQQRERRIAVLRYLQKRPRDEEGIAWWLFERLAQTYPNEIIFGKLTIGFESDYIIIIISLFGDSEKLDIFVDSNAIHGHWPSTLKSRHRFELADPRVFDHLSSFLSESNWPVDLSLKGKSWLAPNVAGPRVCHLPSSINDAHPFPFDQLSFANCLKEQIGHKPLLR